MQIRTDQRQLQIV